MSIVGNGTPPSYKEAMRSSEADQWKKATDNGCTAINTYILVSLPKDRKSVTTKWIYKIKYNVDSTVDCYKARWMLDSKRLYTMQNYLTSGMYGEPMPCHIKNAFLQVEMKEEEMIYITQPEGYVDADHPNWVCLLKSLYGIKQAPRVWNKTLHKFLIKSNFNQSYAYPIDAITLATTSEAVHNQVKPVRTKVHHQYKTIANGYVKVEHKQTSTMTADLLTKSLSRVKFTTLLKHLQVQ
jgi:hypothetical protein